MVVFTRAGNFFRIMDMKSKNRISAVIAFIFLFITISENANASSRGMKKIGLNVGLITEPLPSLIGYGFAYNVSNKVRLGFGYGTISSSDSSFTINVKTVGLDAKYFITNSNLALFLCGGASHISGSISGSGSIAGLSLSKVGNFFTTGAGLDWQSDRGLNLGIEYKLLFGSGISGSGAPGGYIGWYF
jgi:hypothetical protein